jgi:hypothetical protein
MVRIDDRERHERIPHGSNESRHGSGRGPGRARPRPLGNAFVQVEIDSTNVVGSDPHNINSVPQPFVKASIQGNDTYTMALGARFGSWYTVDYNTLIYYGGHRLSVNVPDDVASVNVAFQMWSYDGRGQNQHTSIVVSSHYELTRCINDYTATLSYSLQAPGQSTTYHLRGCDPPDNGPLYAAPLNVTIRTIVPNRVTTDLIVPADYSGVYNVTNASGAIVGRRYVGEPRFVAILLNATTWRAEGFNCWCGPPIPMSFLVPRSVFFETELYKRLNASNPTPPLDKLTFRQNDTSASANSDSIQEILTGNVTMGDWVSILFLLEDNATNVPVRTALRLTNDLLLYSLPDDIVRFIAYAPPLTAPSTTYTFCTGQCGPQTQPPWWELLWTGLLIVAAVLSAVILPINAFLYLAQVLVQVGNWLWTNIVGPGIAIVKSAVQAAGKVLSQVLDWVVAFVTNLLKALFKPVLDAIEQYLASVRATVQAATVELQGTNPSPDEHADRAAQIVTGLLLGGTFLLFLALAIALLTVDVAAKPITALAGLVVPLVTSVAMGLILGAVAVGLFPISNADTGNSPDNVDFIPEFVVDYIPVTAWWDTRAPLTFGRFASTVLIILVRHFVLDDPVGISAIAESMLLSITGLILFVVSPQLQGPAGLVGTGVGFAFTLLGFIRVAFGARLKTIAPLVYYVALALAITSVAMGGLSVARLG